MLSPPLPSLSSDSHSRRSVARQIPQYIRCQTDGRRERRVGGGRGCARDEHAIGAISSAINGTSDTDAGSLLNSRIDSRIDSRILVSSRISSRILVSSRFIIDGIGVVADGQGCQGGRAVVGSCAFIV